jgi:hypothetical protein
MLPLDPGHYLVTKGRKMAARAARAVASGSVVTPAGRQLRIIEDFASPFARPMPKGAPQET